MSSQTRSYGWCWTGCGCGGNRRAGRENSKALSLHSAKILLATNRTSFQPQNFTAAFSPCWYAHPISDMEVLAYFAQGVCTPVVGIQFSMCKLSQINCQIEYRFQI